MHIENSLQNRLSEALNVFQKEFESKYPIEDLIKIDLHCHDLNSDVPDEIMGRILNVPETWLKTDDLLKELRANDVDSITITNHNNARSCFELQKLGVDVLVGAEFSCMVPDFGVGIHVLTYGFTEDQEKILLKRKNNIYSFLEYTKENDIPTIWAHPLYYYSKETPSIAFFEKMSLLFERFEILNGQRDTWQNMLTKLWVDHLTPEIIHEYEIKHNIDSRKYSNTPFKKRLTGGSDSHIGLFAGKTGTYLYLPDLHKRRANESLSKLALEALKNGETVPYGAHHNSEKMTIALLDYVCQIALNYKDPGLLRILLHQGTIKDKALSLIVSNVFSELQHHKITMKFIELFHSCILGNQPQLTKRWFIPKDYKPIFDSAVKIAHIKKKKMSNSDQLYQEAIQSIHANLVKLLYSRLNKKISDFSKQFPSESIDFNRLLNQFEIPSEIRTVLGKQLASSKKSVNRAKVKSFLDGLTFPLLASGIVLAAHFTSAKVLFNNRKLLNQFADKLNQFQHPKRMLWLTDSFDDRNGVSMFLQTMLHEIQKRDLPIDLLVCSATVEPDDHLIVIPPLLNYQLPNYQNQSINIPDFLQIHKLFQLNEYDRVMCSTEGPMGLASLYLKSAFSVEANFYIHTDWVMFGRKVLNLERPNLNRFRRMLRTYYSGFDQLFVLNTDHEKWMTSREMNMNREKVHLTAHWVDDCFQPLESNKKQLFKVNNTDPVILFSGRISHEKGVMELVELFNIVKKTIPNIKLIIVGTGPAENELKQALPEASYLGWVKHEQLPLIYSSADLLILPSKFDTFSCVTLEALCCGLPVVSYNTKGPKDIIANHDCGFLVNNIQEMAESVVLYMGNDSLQKQMKNNAVKRSADYSANEIIERLIVNLNL